MAQAAAAAPDADRPAGRDCAALGEDCAGVLLDGADIRARQTTTAFFLRALLLSGSTATCIWLCFYLWGFALLIADVLLSPVCLD